MVEKSHTFDWWPQLYEPIRNIGQRVADWFAPRSDASALEDYYEINVELPGVKAEDVDVTVQDASVMVRGHKQSERHERGRTYFFSEREYGSFQRSFRLPTDADSEKIEAAFEDGVLNLKIAKQASAQAKEKKIEIRSG